MHEKDNLKWITIYENGFLNTIYIGDDHKIGYSIKSRTLINIILF